MTLDTKGLLFTEDPHGYTLDGIPVPGVTTILKVLHKPWLGPWMVKEAMGRLKQEWKPGKEYTGKEIEAMLKAAKSAHKDKSDAAKDVGTLTHKWIEAYWKGEVAKPEPLIERPVSSFMKWVERHKVEPWRVEQILVSRENWYAGTCDLIGLVDGVPMILDLKTSERIGDDYWLQLAAYQRATADMHPRDARVWEDLARAILRVPKDGKDAEFKIRDERKHRDSDLAGFESCLILHRWQLKQEEE